MFSWLQQVVTGQNHFQSEMRIKEINDLGNYFLITTKNRIVRFEVFMAMKIPVEVFWVVTLCSAVVVHQHFGGPCCLHL
jgi:hypothetical protein